MIEINFFKDIPNKFLRKTKAFYKVGTEIRGNKPMLRKKRWKFEDEVIAIIYWDGDRWKVTRKGEKYINLVLEIEEIDFSLVDKFISDCIIKNWVRSLNKIKSEPEYLERYNDIKNDLIPKIFNGIIEVIKKDN